MILHSFIVRTKQNLDEHGAVESIKEEVCNDSRCSVNKIMPNLVPVVLESSIKLSENSVIVCVFVQKMGENGKKKKKKKKTEGKGGGKSFMSRKIGLERAAVG